MKNYFDSFFELNNQNTLKTLDKKNSCFEVKELPKLTELQKESNIDVICQVCGQDFIVVEQEYCYLKKCPTSSLHYSSVTPKYLDKPSGFFSNYQEQGVCSNCQAITVTFFGYCWQCLQKLDSNNTYKQRDVILYCKECSYRLNLPESIKRGVCLACYEKKHGRITPQPETVNFQLELVPLAGNNPLTPIQERLNMKLVDFLKGYNSSTTTYTKLEKNSSTILRFLTPEPTCCLPVWFDNQEGKRRKLNSISIDGEGKATNLKCPILGLSKETPHRTVVYGVYNFNIGRVELLCVSQLSILRGLNALEQSLNAKNKEITSYNLIISRADTGGKTTYNVSFAADHDLSEQDKQIINEAMDKNKSGNIFQLIKSETRWPTQDEVNNLGLKIVLPDLSEALASNKQDAVPF